MSIYNIYDIPLPLDVLYAAFIDYLRLPVGTGYITLADSVQSPGLIVLKLSQDQLGNVGEVRFRKLRDGLTELELEPEHDRDKQKYNKKREHLLRIQEGFFATLLRDAELWQENNSQPPAWMLAVAGKAVQPTASAKRPSTVTVTFRIKSDKYAFAEWLQRHTQNLKSLEIKNDAGVFLEGKEFYDGDVLYILHPVKIPVKYKERLQTSFYPGEVAVPTMKAYCPLPMVGELDAIVFHTLVLNNEWIEVQVECIEVQPIKDYFHNELLPEIAAAWPEAIIKPEYEEQPTGAAVDSAQVGQPTGGRLNIFTPKQRGLIDEACIGWAGRGFIPKMGISEYLQEFEKSKGLYLTVDQFKEALQDAGRRGLIVKGENRRWQLPKICT